jgi:hypothetical protein
MLEAHLQILNYLLVLSGLTAIWWQTNHEIVYMVLSAEVYSHCHLNSSKQKKNSAYLQPFLDFMVMTNENNGLTLQKI